MEYVRRSGPPPVITYGSMNSWRRPFRHVRPALCVLVSHFRELRASKARRQLDRRRCRTVTANAWSTCGIPPTGPEAQTSTSPFPRCAISAPGCHRWPGSRSTPRGPRSIRATRVLSFPRWVPRAILLGGRRTVNGRGPARPESAAGIGLETLRASRKGRRARNRSKPARGARAVGRAKRRARTPAHPETCSARETPHPQRTGRSPRTCSRTCTATASSPDARRSARR